MQNKILETMPDNDLSDVMIEDMAKDYIQLMPPIEMQSIKKELKREGENTLEIMKKFMRKLQNPKMMIVMMNRLRVIEHMKPFPYRETL